MEEWGLTVKSAATIIISVIVVGIALWISAIGGVFARSSEDIVQARVNELYYGIFRDFDSTIVTGAQLLSLIRYLEWEPYGIVIDNAGLNINYGAQILGPGLAPLGPVDQQRQQVIAPRSIAVPPMHLDVANDRWIIPGALVEREILWTQMINARVHTHPQYVNPVGRYNSWLLMNDSQQVIGVYASLIRLVP
jgi:hypothetical protein